MPYNVKLEKLHLISKETNIPYNVIKNFSYIQMYKLYLLLKQQHIDEIYTFKE